MGRPKEHRGLRAERSCRRVGWVHLRKGGYKTLKYATIYIDKPKGRVNLGDCMQLLAIENLLKSMDVCEDEIVRIGLSELSGYDGEYVIMPVAFPFASFSNGTNITDFSDRIIPVFLSLCILADTLSDTDVAYLKSYEPIGCRDVRTLETMRKYDIMSYLNGCMTLTLPRVNRDIKKDGHVYLIDVPDDILSQVPKELLSDARTVTPIVDRDQIKGTCEDEAARYYANLIDDARLVITTRLHAALPCFAAGLPVIFLKNDYSYRFAGVDAVVPFFDAKSFEKIDWNPPSLDFESHKQEVIALARKRLKEAMNKWGDICDLSYRLESKERPEQIVESLTNTFKYLSNNWSPEKPQFYVLWGLTQTAASVFSHISANYPKAELIGVFDLRNKGIIGGKEVTKPSPIAEAKDPVTIFACTAAAAADVKNYAEASGFDYYNCFVVDEDLIRKENK